MRCFSVNAKDLFDPKVNPGLNLTTEHAEFVRTIAEAKDEMDADLSRGEEPLLDERKLERIMTYVRYHQSMLWSYQRHIPKLIAAVLAQKTIEKAGQVVCKAFRWEPEHQAKGELVARAILQFEMHKRNNLRRLANQELRALAQVSKSWGKK